MRLQGIRLAVGVCVIAGTSQVSAQTAEPPAPDGPPPPLAPAAAPSTAPVPPGDPPAPVEAPPAPLIAVPAADPRAHRHDGFYARLGLGIGYFGGMVESPYGDLSVRSLGVATEIGVGGTVGDGFVVGGVLAITSSEDVTWRGDALSESDFGDGRDEVEGGNSSTGFLGVLVDYYPDPFGGFHVQGALGVGTMHFDGQGGGRLPSTTWSGGSFGLMLGAGYEFWIAEQWSLGGVARLVLTRANIDDGDETEMEGRAFSPALMFVGTHH